jgi:hypothetical protein
VRAWFQGLCLFDSSHDFFSSVALYDIVASRASFLVQNPHPTHDASVGCHYFSLHAWSDCNILFAFTLPCYPTFSNLTSGLLGGSVSMPYLILAVSHLISLVSTFCHLVLVSLLVSIIFTLSLARCKPDDNSHFLDCNVSFALSLVRLVRVRFACSRLHLHF